MFLIIETLIFYFPLSSFCISCLTSIKNYKSYHNERSRLADARDSGILEMAKSLIQSGMPIYEVAKHTPYNAEELEQMLLG